MKITVLHVARTNAYAIAAVAGTMSYGHQYTLLSRADLGVYAGAIPLTVDLLAFSAAMVRNSDRSDAVTRRVAGWVLLFAGTMSVAANVAVGHNLIQRIAGVWTVAAYLLAEWFAARMKAKPEPEPEVEQAPTAPRYPSAAERVIAARMKHPRANVATIAKKAKVAVATARRVLETVPTSPVPVDEIA